MSNKCHLSPISFTTKKSTRITTTTSLIIWSILFLLLLQTGTKSVTGLHPIVLVPGDGGSQIDAKLNKPSVVHYICNKKTNDYFNIWLNLELLVPLVIDCWIDNVRLVYNISSRTTSNSPGVEIRVPGFGNTTTVEYLDPSKASPGVYFKFIVEQSLIPLGYERNEDVRGAPYDFRKAPNEMGDWMRDFKKLVEHSYNTNGNKSVILLAHSMGSPLSLYFLNQMSQEWKDKYVRALMTLAGVWGGSVKALKVFAAGDDLGAYVLPAKTLRDQQKTSPSTAWLLPSSKFWKSTETLVELEWKSTNYTVSHYEDFFNEMNYPLGYEMTKDTQDLIKNLPHPGVEVHCLYGSGVSTVESLHYKAEKDFPMKPSFLWGNGDGTVNIRSLRGCLKWIYDKPPHLLKRKKGYVSNGTRATVSPVSDPNVQSKKKQKPKVFYEEFPGIDHMAILKDSAVVDYLKNKIGQMNGEVP